MIFCLSRSARSSNRCRGGRCGLLGASSRGPSAGARCAATAARRRRTLDHHHPVVVLPPLHLAELGCTQVSGRKCMSLAGSGAAYCRQGLQRAWARRRLLTHPQRRPCRSRPPWSAGPGAADTLRRASSGGRLPGCGASGGERAGAPPAPRRPAHPCHSRPAAAHASPSGSAPCPCSPRSLQGRKRCRGWCGPDQPPPNRLASALVAHRALCRSQRPAIGRWRWPCRAARCERG